MRQIPPSFQDHLDAECITLCNCWRILRKDGVQLGFTDRDQDIAFDATLFEAASGLEPSEMEGSIALKPDNHELLGALQSDSISEEDISLGRYDNARVEHFIVNWSEPDERLHTQTFLLSDLSRADGVFKAELKSLSSVLDQTKMRRFERQCSADFGDSKCGIDVANNFTSNAVISAESDGEKIRVTGLAGFEDHWFSGGKVEFVSGANSGISLEIVDQIKIDDITAICELTLWQPVPRIVEVGDQLTVRAGCDKRFSTCRTRFSNQLNFRGFPHMPGNDFASSYAANSQDMDGGAIYP